MKLCVVCMYVCYGIELFLTSITTAQGKIHISVLFVLHKYYIIMKYGFFILRMVPLKYGTCESLIQLQSLKVTKHFCISLICMMGTK